MPTSMIYVVMQYYSTFGDLHAMPISASSTLAEAKENLYLVFDEIDQVQLFNPQEDGYPDFDDVHDALDKGVIAVFIKPLLFNPQ